MMPKTAVNFYNMKKGLYLGNKAEAQYLADAMSTQAMSGILQVGSDHLAIERSINMLNAYGEISQILPKPMERQVTGGAVRPVNAVITEAEKSS